MTALKLAELTSGVGALVLGVGLGAAFASTLSGLATPTLIIGLVMHAWGMWETHRLEAAESTPGWAQALYWGCWLAVAGVLLWVVAAGLVTWLARGRMPV